MEKLIDTETFSLELENNILIGIICCDLVDLEYAKKVVTSRQELTKGENFPILVKLYSFKKLTKEARDYFASKQACEGILAGAIYTESVLENTIANLFLLLSPPAIPTKVFKNEEKAMEWLKQFSK